MYPIRVGTSNVTVARIAVGQPTSRKSQEKFIAQGEFAQTLRRLVGIAGSGSRTGAAGECRTQPHCNVRSLDDRAKVSSAHAKSTR